jgi:hypothetical protein
MTTLQEVFNALKIKQMAECTRRKIEEPEIGDGEFLLYYDLVIDEIHRELNIVDVTTEIAVTPVTVFTEYALPVTYGAFRSAKLIFSETETELELVDFNEIPFAGTPAQGTPTKIAIYQKTDGLSYATLSPVSGFTGTLHIRHKYITPINAGGGASPTMTTALSIPNQYKALLLHGLMGQLFPDMEQKFYAFLEKAKGDRSTPVKATTNYELGFDEENYNDTKLGL